jgi:hypothetical protein
MNKILFFQADDGRYCRLDQIVTIQTSLHGKKTKLITLMDGSWVYISEQEFDQYIAPHIEILFETSLLETLHPVLQV